MDGTTITEVGLQLQFIIIPWAFLILGVLAIIFGILVAIFDSEGASIGAICCGFLSACAGVAWILAPIPYDSHYWPIYSVEGQIESISNGVAEGDDLTYRVYVVQFEGDPRPYLVDDARITALQGQEVELKCQITWNYQAADQWNCDIRSAAYTQ